MSGAPRLNRRLALLAPDRVPDGSGGFAETWAELGRLWAAVEMRSGAESGAEEAPLGALALKITVRAAAPGSPQRPVPGQVLAEGPRRYRVLAVGEADVGGRFLVCHAREEEVAQ